MLTFLLGIVKLSKNQVLNFTDFPATVSRVLDNNFETYYASHEMKNASWFMKLDSVHLMKWFLISVRGGNNQSNVQNQLLFLGEQTISYKVKLPRVSLIRQY